MRNQFVGLLLSLWATSVVLAESCSDVLQQGIRDEIKIETYDDFKTKFKAVMSMTYDELKAEANKGSGGGEVAIGVLKAVGGGGGEEQRFAEMKQAFALNEDSFLQSTAFKSVALNLVNKSVVDAWQNCMSGAKVLDFYTGDPSDEFTVGIKYARKSSGDAPSIEVSDATVSNLTLMPNVANEIRLKPGLKIEEFETVLQRFKRIDRTQKATINVALGGNGNVAFSFDAVVPPAPSPPVVTLPKPPEVVVKTLINDHTKFQCPLDQKAGDNNLGGNWLLGGGKIRFELRPNKDLFLLMSCYLYEANDQGQPAGDGTRRFGEAEVKIDNFAGWETIEVVVPGGGPPTETILWPISPIGYPAMGQDTILNTPIASLMSPLQAVGTSCRAATTSSGLVGGWGMAAGNKMDIEFKKVQIRLTRPAT